MNLTNALFDLCKEVARPIIAIDGPAGGGKTTLAEHLSSALSLKYKCQTIHMDDLYNGWQAAFDHHLSDALLAIAQSHQKSTDFLLTRYNWQSGSYDPPMEMQSSELLIFEGVGSTQRLVRPFITVSIWIEIDRNQGLNRVLQRDGDGNSFEMRQWLEEQEQHFRLEGGEKSADFVLTN